AAGGLEEYVHQLVTERVRLQLGRTRRAINRDRVALAVVLTERIEVDLTRARHPNRAPKYLEPIGNTHHAPSKSNACVSAFGCDVSTSLNVFAVCATAGAVCAASSACSCAAR